MMCLQPGKSRAATAEQKRLSKLPPRLAKQREQSLKDKKHKPSVPPLMASEIPSLFSLNVMPTAALGVGVGGGGGDSNNVANAPVSRNTAGSPAVGGNTFQIENWDNEMANNIPNINPDSAAHQQQQQGQQGMSNDKLYSSFM